MIKNQIYIQFRTNLISLPSWQRGKHPTTSVLDMTSNGEALVMLELWGMQSTSLSSLPGPLYLGVVAPDRVLSMSQIELFDS